MGEQHAPHEPLLEREGHLQAADELLTEVLTGDVRAFLVQGPAGIGKTSLLQGVVERAAERGLAVHQAAGDDLVAGSPYGVLLQLFAPPVRQLGRNDLADGPARLAIALLRDFHKTPASGLGDLAAVAYSFCWLAQELAEMRPRMLCVDDAHWADVASLRVLAMMARHLKDTPVLLGLAARSDPSVEVAEALGRLDRRQLELDPLTEGAVAELVGQALGTRGPDGLVHELWVATSGNPFLLHELLVALRTRGWSGTGGDLAQLRALAPESIRRFVLRRLAAAGDSAQRLARAAAVLGEAELRDAARLAELDQLDAVAAADRLSAAQILLPGTFLRFVHPILRDTVRADIPAAHRALAHSRAARILADAGVQPDRVAAHLVEAFPRNDPWVVDTLSAAAGRACDRGSPETALTWLSRALEEPPSQQVRSSLAVELGSVQAALGRTEALATLDQAIEWAVDGTQRAGALVWKARALFMVLETGKALALLDELTADPHGVDPEQLLRFDGEVLGSARLHAETRDQALSRLDGLAGVAMPARPATVAILANLTLSAVEGNAPSDTVADLAHQALTNGWLVDESSNQIAHVANALTWVDLVDEAVAVVDAVLSRARRTGSLMTATMAYAVRSRANLRRGAVTDAQADAGIADALAREHDWHHVLPLTSSHLANALIHTGELQEAGEVLQRAAEEPSARSIPDYLDSLGRLHLARSEPETALGHFLDCGQRLSARGGVDAPGVLPWRSRAALALSSLGDTGGARELAREELALAETSGIAGAIGVARSALGVAERGEAGIAWLESAVAVLDHSPQVLARIEALVELGAKTRRGGQPRAARPHLALALDLAHRHGATMLGERARVELVASGARPRRPAVTGLDALTASERRVAELTAAGLTNRQIAQQLYVSMRTVATHLTHIYQKLGLTGRDEIAEVLRH